jgi:CheY-like chemotaxis protein
MNILCVDDDADFLDLTATFLERNLPVATIHTATRIHDAYHLLETEPITCIVSDYEMPEQTGLEFLGTVRETYPDLPFILFTGKAQKRLQVMPYPQESQIISRNVEQSNMTVFQHESVTPLQSTRQSTNFKRGSRNSRLSNKSLMFYPAVTASQRVNCNRSWTTSHSRSSIQSTLLPISL